MIRVRKKTTPTCPAGALAFEHVDKTTQMGSKEPIIFVNGRATRISLYSVNDLSDDHLFWTPYYYFHTSVICGCYCCCGEILNANVFSYM